MWVKIGCCRCAEVSTPMQPLHTWACASLYRVWRPFAAGAGLIEPTEWSGVDPAAPIHTNRTLLRKHAIQKVHLRRDKEAHAINASRCSCRMTGDGPAGAPDLCVAAGGALGVGPGGRAHHLHRCSLATYGLAHLSTDSGVRSAPGQASSSSLSGAASIRFCLDIQTP